MATAGYRAAWRRGRTVSQSVQCWTPGLGIALTLNLGPELKENGEISFLLEQEWVEALSFYHFLATGTVVTYSQVNSIVVDWLSQPVYISGEGRA